MTSTTLNGSLSFGNSSKPPPETPTKPTTLPAPITVAPVVVSAPLTPPSLTRSAPKPPVAVEGSSGTTVYDQSLLELLTLLKEKDQKLDTLQEKTAQLSASLRRPS